MPRKKPYVSSVITADAIYDFDDLEHMGYGPEEVEGWRKGGLKTVKSGRKLVFIGEDIVNYMKRQPRVEKHHRSPHLAK